MTIMKRQRNLTSLLFTSLPWAFAAALIAGTLGIGLSWVLSNLGWIPQALANWITVLVPLGAMVGYVLIGLRHEHADTGFADSVYYMGFLFTLIAMAVSLLGVGSATGVTTIVARFGIAVVTTIVGLALRILLTNFRPGAEDSRALAEDALAETATRLKTILEGVSRDMLAQSQLMTSSLKSAVEKMDLELAAALESSISVRSDATSEFRKSLATSSHSIGDFVDQTTTSVSKGNTAIHKQVRELTGQLEVLRSELHIPKDLFTNELKPAVANLKGYLSRHTKSLERLADKQAVAEEAATRLVDTIDLLKEASETLKGTMEGVSDISTETTALAQSLTNLTNSYQGHASSVTAHGETLTAIKESAESDLNAIRGIRQKLEGELAQATAAVQQVHRELVAASKYVADELGRK